MSFDHFFQICDRTDTVLVLVCQGSKIESHWRNYYVTEFTSTINMACRHDGILCKKRIAQKHIFNEKYI